MRRFDHVMKREDGVPAEKVAKLEVERKRKKKQGVMRRKASKWTSEPKAS